MRRINVTRIRLFVLSLAFMASFISPAQVMAQDASAQACNKSFLGLPTWYAYLEVSDPPKCLPLNSQGKPIEGVDDLVGTVPKIIVAIVDALLRVAGVVAFVFIVASGFRFVLSQGDPGKEKQARTALFNAVIGMVIAMLAAFIVAFIGRRLS